ncbi:MAG: hypothetical protein CM15mP51_15520 [Porticoccaceae bacterium]|nr:MAG: hypothetical protein CM15mP51_15520 [Porticoccaceae bacterium]
MSWNEQGGDKDPWGGRRGDQAPPDIDEALKRLKEKVTAFTGKKGSGKGSGSGGGISGVKNLLPIFFTGLLVLYGLAGVYQVDEKEQAVILRLGVYHNTVGSGLHWNPPLIDSVTVLGVTEERQYSTEASCLPKTKILWKLRYRCNITLPMLKILY